MAKSKSSKTSLATRMPNEVAVPNLLGDIRQVIEAAREHGTYQLIKQEMNFNGKAQDKPLPGNEEITSASLSYRDK